ncbi:MAG: S-layer protein [Candidatus Aenigmatarchaeota archaeon]
MKEKLIAGLMAALTALTTVYPVLAVTVGDAVPSLGTPAEDWLIVVGAAAKPDDVVGAADIAVTLAGLSTEEVAVPGAGAAVVGYEKEIAIGDSDISNDFPAAILKQVQLPFLQDSTIKVGTSTKRYYEQIILPDGDISNDYSAFNDSVVIDLRTLTTPLEYRLVFAEAFNLSQGGYGITKPLTLKILGQTFNIIAVGANSFDVISGTTGKASPTVPLVYGDYKIYSDMGKDNAWAQILIRDKNDNPVETMWLDDPDVVGGTSEKEASVADLVIRILNIRALDDGTIVGVEMVVGKQGEDLTKTYLTGDEFPGYPDWKFNLNINGGAPDIAANDYIGVKYSPDLAREKWFKEGEGVVVPNNYFELKHNGFSVTKFASLTVEKVSGITIYDSSKKAISDLSGVSGFLISSDNKILAGTYEKAYVVFKQDSSTNRTWINATLAYVDPTKDNRPIYASSKRLVSNSTESGYAPEDLPIAITYESSSYSLVFESSSVTGTALHSLAVVPVNLTGYTKFVTGNYTFKDAYFNAKMGATEASVDSKDVALDGADISSQETDIVYDTHGSIVKAVKSNVQADKMVFSLPADTQKVKVIVGRSGAAAEGQTYKKYLPVTAPVARLDTELTSADRAKNLVVVGGPCVNKEAAAALGLTFPACEAASGIPENAAIIKVVEGYPATGKYTVVVAGWEAANTRTACAVIQQYETLLKGQTASAVKVTAATTEGITPL